MDQILEQFKQGGWDNQWSGKWFIPSITSWGRFYCRKPFSQYFDNYVNRAIVVHENGISSCHQRHEEKEAFSKIVVEKARQNDSLLYDISQTLKDGTDIAMELMEEYFGEDMTFEEYDRYRNAVLDYYTYHIVVKVAIDFLPEDLLKKYIDIFEESRLYAEPVFSKNIEFMTEFFKVLSQKTGQSEELIKAMTDDELGEFLKNGIMPDNTILEARNKRSAYLYFGDKTQILVGEEVDFVVQVLSLAEQNSDEIKGVTAYPGIVSGRVRVIMDPSNPGDFTEGDILVTGMTRPEYLSLVQKSAGYITDAGGMLSHAAITARELKKPCVVGTQIATKALKDGMMIEVDAENGMVKIIK